MDSWIWYVIGFPRSDTILFVATDRSGEGLKEEGENQKKTKVLQIELGPIGFADLDKGQGYGRGRSWRFCREGTWPELGRSIED